MHHEGIGRRCNAADRLEISARIVAGIAVEARPDRQRAGIAQKDGVTVGRTLGDRAAADRAAGAAAVVDHDRLAKRLAHLVGDDARDDGGAAAGRERHHQGDGTVGIILRGGRHAQAGGERDQREPKRSPDRHCGIPRGFCSRCGRKPITPIRCPSTARSGLPCDRYPQRQASARVVSSNSSSTLRRRKMNFCTSDISIASSSALRTFSMPKRSGSSLPSFEESVAWRLSFTTR